jgi:hypothetical protein
MLSKKKIAIGMIMTLIVVGTIYVAMTVVSRRRIARKYERGYQQIKLGDSKDVVLTLMGEPSRITDCVHPWFSDKKAEDEYRVKCKELYLYEEVFPVDYTVSFDEKGNVVNKTSAVSP